MGLYRKPDGTVVTVPDDQAPPGYTPVSATEATGTAAAQTPEDTGVVGGINAASTGFLSGLTLGGSDFLLKGFLDKGAGNYIAQAREQHPISGGAGQLAGMIVPSLVAPESLLARSPAGLLSRGAGSLAESGTAAAKIAASAVEGAGQNAGMYLSDTALGDRDLTAEGLAGALGSGFEFGAAGGVAALGIEKGTIAARRMFSRASAGERAAAEAEQAWQTKYQETIEAHDTAADIARAKLAEAQTARMRAGLERDQARAAQAEARATAAAAPPSEVSAAGVTAPASAMSPDDAAKLFGGDGIEFAPGGLTGLGPTASGEIANIPVARVGGEADLRALAEALAEHDAARLDLDSILQKLDAPDVGEVGGELGLGSGKVPVWEFGGRARTPQTVADLKQAMAVGSDVSAARPAVSSAPESTRVRRGGARGTPVEHAPARPSLDDIGGGPPAATSPSAASKAGVFDLAAADVDQLEMLPLHDGSYYLYDPASKSGRSLTAEEFARGPEAMKALPPKQTEIPSYGAIKAREGDADDYLELVVPAKDIARRGYYEPPGGGTDAVRVSNARKAITEGQRESIKLNLSQDGKITVTDGRHRLAAAIENDAPISVKWSTGAEPAADDVLRHGVVEPSSSLTGLLRGTQERLAGGASLNDIGAPVRAEYAAVKAERTASAGEHFRGEALGDYSTSPMAAGERAAQGEALAQRAGIGRRGQSYQAIRKLEMAHDAAVERVAVAVDPVERVAAQAEVRAIEQQLTAVGTRPGPIEDIAAVAGAMTKYEDASAKLVDALGPDAPQAAREAAQVFRSAESDVDRKLLDRATRAIDDHVSAGAPPNAGPASTHPRVQPWEVWKKDKFLKYLKREGYNSRAMEAMGRDYQAYKAAAIAAASPKAAAASAQASATESAFTRARLAETEARLNARTTAQAAKDVRAAADAARPVPPGPASTSRLGDIVTAIGVAGELGVPGVPHPHDIPVIGPLLSAYVKFRAIKAAAGRFSGRVPATGEARAAALASRTKDRVITAVDRTLGLVADHAPKARAAIVATATALGRRAFDDGEPDAPRGATSQEIAAVRIREIATAAARPEMVAQHVRVQLRGITDPDLIAAAERHMIARFQYLASVMPKMPPANPFSPTKWVPSPAATADVAQRLAVANNPEAAFIDPTPAKAETLRNLHPQLFELAKNRLISRFEEIDKPIPNQQLLRASLLFDAPLVSSLEPDSLAILQGAHASTRALSASPVSGPAPNTPPLPSIANPTDLTSIYQPAGDRRAARH